MCITHSARICHNKHINCGFINENTAHTHVLEEAGQLLGEAFREEIQFTAQRGGIVCIVGGSGLSQ